MLFIGCSDAIVNSATQGVYDSFRYLNDYRWGMTFIVVLFIYIDYFGLVLSYGGEKSQDQLKDVSVFHAESQEDLHLKTIDIKKIKQDHQVKQK